MSEAWTAERMRNLFEEVKNWGRWGAEDEKGALNLITPEVVVRAAGCVRSGKTFSLGLRFGPHGPQVPGGMTKRFNPIHSMTQIGEPVGDDFRWNDDIGYEGRLPAGQLCTVGKIEILGQRIRLPASGIFNSRFAPHASRAIEIHEETEEPDPHVLHAKEIWELHCIRASIAVL